MLRAAVFTVALASLAAPLAGQDWKSRQTAALAYLDQNAVMVPKVMMPMRDGTRLAALLIFPKAAPRRNLPAVIFRSPYQVEPGEVERFAIYLQSLIQNGYVAVIQSVRGRYFSEGTYTFMGGSGDDGFDSVDWIAKQEWSNGKVGALGCSSTAEEQHKLNGRHHPAFAAAVPIASGAGIGRVGPYNEMGNFYRGGVVQNLWFSWYYSAGYKYRPSFSPDLPRSALLRLSRFWNLEPEKMPDPGIDTLIWTLPLNKIPERMGAAPSDLDDFVNRLPNDPKWKAIEFGDESDPAGAPMLMINSWYDVSIGPNTAMYRFQAANAATENARNNMFMVIAPTTHCAEGRVESEHTIVGERDLGDARFDYVGLVQRWFDHFLKGVDNGVTKGPKVRAYMMGSNQWRSYDAWPPREVRPVTYYLTSGGSANSRLGDGRLTTVKPARAGQDGFTYDPMHPVPSLGGSICCFGPSLQGGAFDQSNIEMRNDVLIYTTAPLAETIEIAGPVEVSLYLSSDVKDTDLAVKLIDVTPDGKAYNLDESIQRVRWREGWDRPVFMEPGKVYRVEVGPLVTSNAFLPGHRIRVEVTSSNFPRFERNLNTGGNNFDETDGVVARNAIHHGAAYPSAIVLPVVNGPSR